MTLICQQCGEILELDEDEPGNLFACPCCDELIAKETEE